jgi:hypothetical protein
VENLVTVLLGRNLIDVRDIDRIAGLPVMAIVPEDHGHGGAYNPYGPR